ncbi:MAG: phosphate acyltransferase [Calditrichaeota bacterium]|jgi:phosphate acyltransferase|nr:phosphate acyltransferase [Calditrichota bacterium]
MKIALDAFGGDYAPEATIGGALLACQKADLSDHSELEVYLFGKKDRILKHLGKNYSDRIKIFDTPNEASNDLVDPHASGRDGNSPIRTALRQHHKGNVDAVVSAGTTGAQVVATLFELEKCSGITRPVIGSSFPTAKGSSFVLDVGARLVASAHHLVQYATMGHVYVQEVLGISNPRIGLLNVGHEKLIGKKSSIDAHKLLSESNFNFIGFVEGHDIPAGNADVVLTNGVVGNVLLKYTEGLPTLLQELLPKDCDKQIRDEIAIRFDSQAYGGEPLLGVKGVSIICHGSSTDRAISSAIMQAERISEVKLHEKIENFFNANKIKRIVCLKKPLA